MKRTEQAAIFVDRRLLLVVVFIFSLNTILVAAGFYVLNSRFLVVTGEFKAKQEIAKELVDYNRGLARTLDVEERSQVKSALSTFNYEIEMASGMEGLSKAILSHGNRTREIILQEFENKQRELILALIRQDPEVLQWEEETPKKLSLSISREYGIEASPSGFLDKATMEKIKENVDITNLAWNLSVDVEIAEGKANLLTPYDPQEQLEAMAQEIDSLRVALHELRERTGFAEMSGAGIIISIHDAKDGHTNDTIIHDLDVRDVVNELFAAGAEGVAVGNQRLITTSAIRCVGPSILVNDKRISVNPVVIRAIGDPAVLASGLDIIRITLELSRDLYFEIEKLDSMNIPAYTQ